MENQASIIFDSGCYVVVTPWLEDFEGNMVKGAKVMIVSGAAVSEKGERNITWNFKDNYRIAYYTR